MNRLLSVRVVAEACGLSVRQIYQLISEGKFPRQTYIEGSSRWSQREIEAWIDARLAERPAQQEVA